MERPCGFLHPGVCAGYDDEPSDPYLHFCVLLKELLESVFASLLPLIALYPLARVC
jgi:hypothetical protein